MSDNAPEDDSYRIKKDTVWKLVVVAVIIGLILWAAAQPNTQPDANPAPYYCDQNGC